MRKSDSSYKGHVSRSKQDSEGIFPRTKEIRKVNKKMKAIDEEESWRTEDLSLVHSTESLD